MREIRFKINRVKRNKFGSCLNDFGEMIDTNLRDGKLTIMLYKTDGGECIKIIKCLTICVINWLN